ncbi:MAG: flagellar basal body rod protein FlgB [Clostridiaceae bacterium]|nr:flagellar basal body rod protein FlgB [Clostridiaceae bacterium]
MNIISNSTQILEKALDSSWKRNEVISNNIANVDTPNFKRSGVRFEDVLTQVLDKNEIELNTSDPRHITLSPKNLDPKIEVDNKELKYRLDGNNVDIEGEMAELAKNSIKYNSLAQSVSGAYKKMKHVISEGRR